MSHNTDTDKQNITFFFDETDVLPDLEKEFDINNILQEIEDSEICSIYDEIKIPQIINYKENYTIKELMLICEYYGFAKEIKNNKYNKEEIIHFLVEFENTISNMDIVTKRKNMWFYMNEVKNDKFMKKYVIWC